MSIDCERCGNCCPTTCESFEIINEEPRLTSCKTYNKKDNRGLCHISPIKLYCCGFACRAILDILNEENIIINIEPNGQRTFSKI